MTVRYWWHDNPAVTVVYLCAACCDAMSTMALYCSWALRSNTDSCLVRLSGVSAGICLGLEVLRVDSRVGSGRRCSFVDFGTSNHLQNASVPRVSERPAPHATKDSTRAAHAAEHYTRQGSLDLCEPCLRMAATLTFLRASARTPLHTSPFRALLRPSLPPPPYMPLCTPGMNTYLRSGYLYVARIS